MCFPSFAALTSISLPMGREDAEENAGSLRLWQGTPRRAATSGASVFFPVPGVPVMPMYAVKPHFNETRR